MKAALNYQKITPQKFAVARDSVKMAGTAPKAKALSYRNNLSYNTQKINHFSAKPTGK